MKTLIKKDSYEPLYSAKTYLAFLNYLNSFEFIKESGCENSYIHKLNIIENKNDGIGDYHQYRNEVYYPKNNEPIEKILDELIKKCGYEETK